MNGGLHLIVTFRRSFAWPSVLGSNGWCLGRRFRCLDGFEMIDCSVFRSQTSASDNALYAQFNRRVLDLCHVFLTLYHLLPESDSAPSWYDLQSTREPRVRLEIWF